MARRRFYRFLWTFNGLLIAVLGLLALAILSLVAFDLYQDSLRPRGGEKVVRAKPALTTEPELSFGRLSTAKGWDSLRIPLESRRTTPGVGSGAVVVATRNFLFHDLQAAEGRWLFPTHGQVILHHRPLTVARNGAKEKVRDNASGTESEGFVLALYYEIVKDDTDNDGRLGAGDRVVLALTLPDGQGYTEVVQDVDRVIGTQAVSDDELLLLYQKAEAAYATRLSLPSFKLLSTKTLAGLDPSD